MGRRARRAAIAAAAEVLEPRELLSTAPALVQADAVVNDPGFPGQWGLENANNVDIDAAAAWRLARDLPTVIVAVIDSGLDVNNPEFAGKVWTDPGEIPGNGVDDDGDGLVDDVHGWNFTENTGDITDDNGHGTHVSGIIAADADNGQGIAGVAPNVAIMPLKFLDSEGDGAMSAAVNAVYFAVAHGARVINASWGGPASTPALRNAIAYAETRGVVFVTAAGNESANNDATRSYPASYRLPNMLSVAAVNARGKLPRYSNYGRRTVDLVAPGNNILSTVPGGYAAYSGTSMSAPFVTAVAAMVRAAHPEDSAAQIVQRIVDTAKPLPGLAGKVISGGIVDAARALGSDPGSPPKSLRDLRREARQARLAARRALVAQRHTARQHAAPRHAAAATTPPPQTTTPRALASWVALAADPPALAADALPGGPLRLRTAADGRPVQRRAV